MENCFRMSANVRHRRLPFFFSRIPSDLNSINRCGSAWELFSRSGHSGVTGGERLGDNDGKTTRWHEHDAHCYCFSCFFDFLLRNRNEIAGAHVILEHAVRALPSCQLLDHQQAKSPRSVVSECVTRVALHHRGWHRRRKRKCNAALIVRSSTSQRQRRRDNLRHINHRV